MKTTQREIWAMLLSRSFAFPGDHPVSYCTAAGMENAMQTTVENSAVEEGSEDFFSLAIRSIAESARGNCVEDIVFPWLRSNGVTV